MASGEMIIKGGFIIDPTRKIDGDVGDVAIKDGKIVDKVSSSAKVIDAKGKIVMAGAVDVHSHVAGPKVNAGRLMRPEDKLLSGFCRSGMAQKNGYRMESGFLNPLGIQDRVRLCPDGIHLRHGSGNAPAPCPPRARGDPRHPHHR